MSELQVEVGDDEIVLSRTFAAPRSLVFEAFTEPEHLMAWYGPREWPLVVCDVDLGEGGTWHYCMRGPDGGEMWGLATFLEVVRPERLVTEMHASDAQRSVFPPSMHTTSTFEEPEPGVTAFSMRTRFGSDEERDQILHGGAVEGYRQTFERLEEYLPTVAARR